MDSGSEKQDVKPLLRVSNLSVIIRQPNLSFLALQKISFSMKAGESLAIVGESGSGKTMTALALLGLLPKNATQTEGNIFFERIRLDNRDQTTFKKIRGRKIAMVFQEPTSALNPVFRVGRQIADVLKTHQHLSSKVARERILKIFEKVRLPDPNWAYRAYPHQLSGGMAQRVMIAMALCCKPKLVIADEPTTALDVTTQAQILKLIRDLQKELGFSLLLISHDINVVSQLAGSIVVMKDGLVIEASGTQELLTKPRKSYTRDLIQTSMISPEETSLTVKVDPKFDIAST